MLKRLEIAGFKSFARKTVLDFSSATTAIVGPNGSGKSNVAEAFRFALGEQSMKSMRGKRSEDLIWAGSHATPRQNRAAVAIVFDNTKRIFPKLEFDEVTIERAVYRDGTSEYTLNGSRVRLRDIQELLAGANIGETGHHIISQGEADRILLSNSKERRSMLEDALGLRVFEFKKQEAERKLLKTEENMREVEAIRRELAPHLRFLSKQVEKLERAEELARELREVARTYFALEEAYLAHETKETRRAHEAASERLAAAQAELAVFESKEGKDSEGVKRAEAVKVAERALEAMLQERSALSRELGRTEGALHAAKRRSEKARELPYAKVPHEDIAALRDEVAKQASTLEGSTDVSALQSALKALRTAVSAFFEKYGAGNDDLLKDEEHDVFALEREHETLVEKDKELAAKVEEARSVLARAREARIAYEETGQEERLRLLSLADSRAHEEANVARAEARIAELSRLADELVREKAEIVPLAGRNAISYEAVIELPQEERRVQEERRRHLERLKIRLEEAGGTGEEVRTEYEEAKAREEFLAREVEDLTKSAEGLRALIEDLDTELQKTFSEGLAKVNASFGEFFTLMFGGGGARLILEEPTAKDEEEEEGEEEMQNPRERLGIDIAVNLPKKRVQSLMQLSGGERALTSIALIFAMSQVNPPPFLILDETDAALDEANSRRYGDMIENLAEKSQLIVITHNRETMSRAGILYGVTMGNDGVSKLLSVRFEEAVSVAK